jgi:hypothetical protein
MALTEDQIAAWQAANPTATTAQLIYALQNGLNPNIPLLAETPIYNASGVPIPAASAGYVAPTLSGATGTQQQAEMAQIFTNNLSPSLVTSTPQNITDFSGLTPDWAGTPSEPIQTYRKAVSPILDAVYDQNGKLTGYEASNNAYLTDNSYVHGSFDVTGKANPVYQTKSAGGFFQGQLPQMLALYGGALGANALGLGSEATGTGLFNTAANPFGNIPLSATDSSLGAAGAANAAAIGAPTTAEAIAAINAGAGASTAGGLLTPSAVSPAAASTAAGVGAGAGAGAGTLTDVLTKAATGVGTGLLSSAATAGVKDLLNPSTIQGGLQTAGGLLQSQASKDAALKAQQDILAATQQATTGAQFRPVGVTTNFGSSQFQIDPKTGQLVSAGYTANPAITSAENQLMQLGSSYLAQTPEQVAQQYLSKQYELLDPSRQRQLASIRNQNFQTGRGGLSVGSTGLRPSGAQGLMGANPELEAYYNALAQQDAQLAAGAQQAGQQQVTYGAGLFGQAGNLESLAQQPFTLGTGLGTAISGAGANAGRINLAGQQIATGYGTSNAATTNPYATLISALGGPTSTLGKGIYDYLNSTAPISTDVIPNSTFTGGITPSELTNYQSMGIF